VCALNTLAQTSQGPYQRICRGQLQGDQCALWNLTIVSMPLFNREDSKKVLPIAGMLKSCPPLLCKTMCKAKKEEAMQELHRNDWGMEDVVMWI
jgi:hypothetical protein